MSAQRMELNSNIKNKNKKKRNSLLKPIAQRMVLVSNNSQPGRGERARN